MQKLFLDPVVKDGNTNTSTIRSLPASTKNEGAESGKRQTDTNPRESHKHYIFQKNQPHKTALVHSPRRLNSVKHEKQTSEEAPDAKFKSRKHRYTISDRFNITEVDNAELVSLKQRCSEQEEIILKLRKENEEIEDLKSQVSSLRRPSYLERVILKRKTQKHDTIDDYLTNISKVSETFGSIEYEAEDQQEKSSDIGSQYMKIQKQYLDEKIKNDVLQEKVYALNAMIEMLTKEQPEKEISIDSRFDEMKLKNTELISKLIKSSDIIFEKSIE